MALVPTDLALTLAVVFVAVALLAWLLASALFTRKAPERQRLEALVAGGVIAPAAGSIDLGAPAQAGGPLVPRPGGGMTRLQRRLATAGYHGAAAATVYSASEIALPILAAGAVLAWLGLQNRTGWVTAVVAGTVAYFVPGLVIERKMTLRKKQIRNGLADVVDLVIICLEAGSSLDQALVKATDDLGITYPLLAEELRILSTETRAGKPRIEAFKNLAQRTGVEEVRELVAMLVQTDRFGTSVAQALRTFAKTSREKRRQRAEEAAAKVGVKLVFPLVFLLFPAFYVVTLGPAVIQFVRVFFGQVVQGR